MLAQVSASSDEPLLLRIFTRDRELAGVPWEALCKPDTNQGFLGTESNLLVARGEYSKDAWQPREVTSAVRVRTRHRFLGGTGPWVQVHASLESISLALFLVALAALSATIEVVRR